MGFLTSQTAPTWCIFSPGGYLHWPATSWMPGQAWIYPCPVPAPGVSVPATSTSGADPEPTSLPRAFQHVFSDGPVYFSTIGVSCIEVYQHYWGRFSQQYFVSISEQGTPPPVNSTSEYTRLIPHLDHLILPCF